MHGKPGPDRVLSGFVFGLILAERIRAIATKAAEPAGDWGGRPSERVLSDASPRPSYSCLDVQVLLGDSDFKGCSDVSYARSACPNVQVCSI